MVYQLKSRKVKVLTSSRGRWRRRETKTFELEGRATLEDTNNRRNSMNNDVQIVEHPKKEASILRVESSVMYPGRSSERREENHSYQTIREVRNKDRRLGSCGRRQSKDLRPVDELRQLKVPTLPPKAVPPPPQLVVPMLPPTPPQ